MASNTSMQGKVIALTGGASGIGLATSKLLHSRGASISIGDIDQAALDSTAAYFNKGDQVNTDSRILLTHLDVSKRTQVDEWIKATVSRFGRLDGAANCAGVIGKHHGLRDVAELEDEQWDLIMGVNLSGMMYSLRAELREMGPGAAVVCLTSIHSTKGFAKHAAYNASKHGILGLVRTAALEFAERKIRINGVAPGLIDTPLVSKRDAFTGTNSLINFTDAAMKRPGTPAEVANTIVFLLSDEASYITGANISVDGGWDA